MQITDKKGRVFDAVRFLHRNGVPVINRLTGLFMPRGGRKPAKLKNKMETPNDQTQIQQPAELTPPPPAAPPPVESAASSAPEEVPGMAELRKALTEGGTAQESTRTAARGDEYTAAGAGTVAAISTLAILSMGAHVKPSQEQTIAMVEAYASAYRHYGYKPEVPPWLGPVITTLVWVGPHFADQRSQDSLQTWKRKIANAWLWLKGKTASRAATSAASDATQ